MRDETKVGLVVLLVLGVILLASSITTIPAGHRGVLLRFGAATGVELEEGINFKTPFIDRVVKTDVRVQKVEVDATAASKDLQTVSSTIALNYHVDPASVVNLYKNVGTNFETTIIAPIIQETVKSVTAKYTAEQLITSRASVSNDIKDALNEKLPPMGIVVDLFNIVNFDFSQEFNTAIEAKQTAEQLALKAQRDLERIKIEAEQKIAQAEAEAKALQVQKQEITPELIQFRAIEKWNGILPNVTGGAVPFISVE